MEYEKIIKLKEKINLKNIFESGQVFRFEEYFEENVKENNIRYICIIGKYVYLLEQFQKNNADLLKINSNDENLEENISRYLDLDTNYSLIKSKLIKKDERFAKIIEYGSGIRILRQDLFEMIITYIISANNNIARIKKIVENISKKYGEEIIFRNKKYYSFPKIDKLKNVTVQEFRSLGLGFRDKYIVNTIAKLLDNKEAKIMEMIKKGKDCESNNMDILKELKTLDGVGNKVANCIMLFGMHIFNTFPVDVWIKRIMILLFPDLKNMKNEEIEKFAKEYFTIGNDRLAGIAQQYLFYYYRNRL